MAWTYLFFASCFEIAWVFSLKRVSGLADYLELISTIILLLMSVFFLSLAIRQIPIGVAYAVWTGIGVTGAVSIGALYYNEPINIINLLCISLILLGIMGLHLSQSIQP